MRIPRAWLVGVSVLGVLFVGSLLFHERHELLVLVNFFSGLGLALSLVIIEHRT